MILLLDTETSGLVKDELDPLDPGQPHMVQLGVQLYDDQWVKRGHLSTLIKPEGWEIEPQAEGVHGISTRLCHRYGIPLRAALVPLMEYCGIARRIVGHNIEFDRKIVKASIRRAGGAGEWWQRAAPKFWCTMEHSTDLCRIPMPPGADGKERPGFKFPSLEEAVNKLIEPGRWGGAFATKHDADADIVATMEVYRVLDRLGLAPGAKAFDVDID